MTGVWHSLTRGHRAIHMRGILTWGQRDTCGMCRGNQAYGEVLDNGSMIVLRWLLFMGETIFKLGNGCNRVMEEERYWGIMHTVTGDGWYMRGNHLGKCTALRRNKYRWALRRNKYRWALRRNKYRCHGRSGHDARLGVT